MRSYVRSRIGSTFFFTVVTHRRRSLLTTDLGRDCLRTAFLDVRRNHPFRTVAIVLLPDHLHAVWELPREDVDYSKRWRLIKRRFSQLWSERGGVEGNMTASRERKGERAIWQRRFFEHTCKDEDDVQRCVDYSHVNPLKHGLVSRVIDWPYSTFHRYVERGIYPPEWGSAAEWYGDEFRHAE